MRREVEGISVCQGKDLGMEHVRIFPRLKDGGREGLCWSASVEHLFSCVRGRHKDDFSTTQLHTQVHSTKLSTR